MISGKIILVYLRSAGATQQAGVALEDPRIEMQLGENFVVGTVPHSDRDWASGLQVAVRESEIQQVLIFDSIEDYQSRIAAAPATWDLTENEN